MHQTQLPRLFSTVLTSALVLGLLATGCAPDAADDSGSFGDTTVAAGTQDTTEAFGTTGTTGATGTTEPVDTTERAGAAYDSLLAQELGADEYGMRRYVMALLTAGPNQDQDSARAAELQRGHMDNINRMAEEGQLVLAGPFFGGSPLRGVYVFDVETVEEARALTETDPAIQAGRLEMELHPWYGPAALMEVKDINERITRQSP